MWQFWRTKYTKKVAFRSSITPRPSPSQLTPGYNLKCIICGQVWHIKISETHKISEKQKKGWWFEKLCTVFTRWCLYTYIQLNNKQTIFLVQTFTIIMIVFRGIYKLLNHLQKHRLRLKRNSKREKGLL